MNRILVTLYLLDSPNAGNKSDAMSYSGSNLSRPYVSGRPFVRGIVEQMVQLFSALVITPKTNVLTQPLRITRAIYSEHNKAHQRRLIML